MIIALAIALFFGIKNKTVEEIEVLKSEHDTHEKYFKDKSELREKLNEKANKIYRWVRVTVVFFYFVINTLAFFLLRRDLGLLLGINQIAFIGFIGFSIIRFNKVSDVKDIFNGLKIYIDERVFQNHKTLDEEIEFHKSQMELKKMQIEDKQKKKEEFEDFINVAQDTLTKQTKEFDSINK